MTFARPQAQQAQSQQPPPSKPVADFRLSVQPESITVRRGSTGRLTVTVAPVNGFNGKVGLVSSLLYQTKTAFTPLVVQSPGSAVLTIEPSKSAISGEYGITITGIDGGLSHTITVDVKVK